jgi:hypothetical protein
MNKKSKTTNCVSGVLLHDAHLQERLLILGVLLQWLFYIVLKLVIPIIYIGLCPIISKILSDIV